MSKTQAEYFVSYCIDDVPTEELEYVKFLIDKASHDSPLPLLFNRLPVGHSLDDFMKLLQTTGSVIVLLTPGYKNHVLERKGGVYTEYKIITQRLEDQQERRERGDDPSGRADYLEVLPVLYSGTECQSVPDELARLKFADLRAIRPHRSKKGEFVATAGTRKFMPLLAEMAQLVVKAAALRGGTSDVDTEQVLKRLFVDVKANWTDLRPEEQHYLDSVFVKTSAYRRVETQSALFLVGRKGSGKSTVTDMLALRNRARYKKHIRVDVDDLNLEFCYTFFSDLQTRSDTMHVFRRRLGFEFAWEAFIRICCIEALVALWEEDDLTDTQAKSIAPLEAFMKSLQGGESHAERENLNRYFVFVLNKLSAFMRQCIASARPEEAFFFSDLQGAFTHGRFLDFAIGSPVLASMAEILQYCRRRFLVTLDNFDTAFDAFRANHQDDELRQRASFEGDWLSGLLHHVLRARRELARDVYFRLLDFCITIPLDRFLEILGQERDTYRYLTTFRWLHWSGLELVVLLRKRLEELTDFRADENQKQQNRLEQVLNERLSHIPTVVTFMADDRRVTMPLFLYVLRFTFWRPRDVLIYYARIIGVCQQLKERRVSIVPSMIRRIIRDATYLVIKGEFLAEFRSTVSNIEDIVRAFTGMKQTLRLPELEAILSRTPFRFTNPETRTPSTTDKIRFLYKTGFIGVRATAGTQDRLNLLGQFGFYFNEGMTPLRGSRAGGLDDLTFVVHPVFEHYLSLDTAGQDPVLGLTWDYLENLEAVLFDTVDGFMWDEA